MRQPETIGLYRQTPEGERRLACLEAAQTPWSRLRGLLGRSRLDPGQGLLLAPCRAIHTFGMRFPIDVFFLSRDNRIVRIRWKVGPMRIVFGGPRADMAVEIQAGWLPQNTADEGDRLVFRAVPRVSG